MCVTCTHISKRTKIILKVIKITNTKMMKKKVLIRKKEGNFKKSTQYIRKFRQNTLKAYRKIHHRGLSLITTKVEGRSKKSKVITVNITPLEDQRINEPSVKDSRSLKFLYQQRHVSKLMLTLF